jgi:hypothetical protein
MLVYSKHAVMVMCGRGYGPEDVEEALRRPWLTTTGAAPGYGNGEKTNHFGRNGITVVTAHRGEHRVVVTVLMQAQEQWTNEDAKNRSKS